MPYYRCDACGLTSYSAAAYSAASTCPNCSAALSDSTRVHVPPGRARTARRVLAARPQAVAEARREVTALPLPPQPRERLSLLVSELVTNAVLHTSAAPDEPLELSIAIRAGRARVVVHDGGDGFDVPSPDVSDALAPGGRGLAIVAALSDDWGVTSDADGCTVWSEIVVRPPAEVIEHRVTGRYVRELAIELTSPPRARLA